MHRLLPVLCLSALCGSAVAQPVSPPKIELAPLSHVLRIADDSSDHTMATGARSDDTDYLWRLGMLEGHLMIGHQLIAANQPSLALPHFGHPVRELYDDIGGYLTAHKFPAFDTELASLEASVASEPSSPETEKKYQAAIETIHKARELAPADIRASLPEMIRVCADTIDAAAGEYGEAMEQGKIATIVEYHDSKGYIAYVNQQVADLQQAHGDAASQAEISHFKTVLAKANYIVDPLLPGTTPRASVGQYRTVAEEAAAIAKQD